MSSTIVLPSKTIAGADDGPHLLITAGVHGDEYEPMAAVRQLVRRFESQELRGRVTLVPIVNLAAFRRGQRTAEDGLDLARTCPGQERGSITQRTAAALSRLIRAADFYVDLHTGGNLFRIAPLAGYMLHQSQAILRQQQAMAAAFNLPIVWGTTARLEGRSLSIARDAHVPAIYVEFGGGAFDPAAVAPLVEGCLQVAARLGMIQCSAPTSRVAYTVEDDRDDSGHLQAQHPSPAEGFFEPRVVLGQAVQAGQALGVVVDTLGETTVEVAARDDGIVLFLRVQASVKVGEPLGGILPIREPGFATFARKQLTDRNGA
jgi:predicted deacylase